MTWLAGALLGQALIWQTMMVVMMAPTAYPWLRAARVVAPAGSAMPATVFGAGYFVAWLPFSLALAALQLDLARGWPMPPVWQGGVLMAAGLYQFAPLKRACLRHCRNPLSYLLGHWEGGGDTAFRLGINHGLVCLGCCWALMATALAVGMMNLLWMAALALAVFAEQVLPATRWLRPALGAALLLGGAVLLV